jgi:ABC-type branched-subunit amino acid transport system substrate-binding protein
MAANDALAVPRDEVRIGVTWSDSGWCWLDSRFMFPALRAWVAETNAAGGFLLPDERRRVPVRLVQYDDASDPDVAVQAVRRLIEVDRVDVLCSSASSEIQRAVVPLSEAAAVVSLNVGPTDSELFSGCRYHLGCAPALGGYYRSRPEFWSKHGLRRVAVLSADLPGWRATSQPLHDVVESDARFELVHWELAPASAAHSTVYGSYPQDFTDWPAVVERIVDARPDVVVVCLPSPAEYHIMREIRRRGVWFPYLEMMYGPWLAHVGLGPEDLTLQFVGGLVAQVDPAEINVGGAAEHISTVTRTWIPSVTTPVNARTWVGVAVWEHLVQRAGSLDSDAVMAQAHAESGTITTVEGRLTWTPSGDVVALDSAWSGVFQLQTDPKLGRCDRFASTRPPTRTTWPSSPGIPGRGARRRGLDFRKDEPGCVSCKTIGGFNGWSPNVAPPSRPPTAMKAQYPQTPAIQRSSSPRCETT